MTKYGHIVWRLVAVVAFVGTAALAVVLTRAPQSVSATLTDVTCPASGLQAWLGLGASGTAGAVASGSGTRVAGVTLYSLEFTNISHHSCQLYGYPEVSAYVGSPPAGSKLTDSPPRGGQISSPAIRDTSVRPQPVTLAPGATAHALLRFTNSGRSGPAACDQVTAEELRVSFPRQGRSASLPVHIPICARQGHLSLSVQAFQARPGIPGYTMP